jgi:hypothetical protein
MTSEPDPERPAIGPLRPRDWREMVRRVAHRRRSRGRWAVRWPDDEPTSPWYPPGSEPPR